MGFDVSDAFKGKDEVQELMNEKPLKPYSCPFINKKSTVKGSNLPPFGCIFRSN